MSSDFDDKRSQLLPRFSIRTLLGLLTVCAIVFVIAGMAYRGQYWAWGITLGMASLAVAALIHAALFGLVWLLGQRSAAEQRNS
jgi:hypothetical protein